MPPPKKKSAVVAVQGSNIHRNKTRFVLGSDASGKTNIGGIIVTGVAVATVTLADDWILSVLSLASSPTPRGGVILMIAMFRRIVYRPQHQSDAVKKNG